MPWTLWGRVKHSPSLPTPEQVFYIVLLFSCAEWSVLCLSQKAVRPWRTRTSMFWSLLTLNGPLHSTSCFDIEVRLTEACWLGREGGRERLASINVPSENSSLTICNLDSNQVTCFPHLSLWGAHHSARVTVTGVTLGHMSASREVPTPSLTLKKEHNIHTF